MPPKRLSLIILAMFFAGCDFHLDRPPATPGIPIPLNASPEERAYYDYINADSYALTDRFGSLRLGITAETVIEKLDKPTSSGDTVDVPELRSGFPSLKYQYFEDFEVVVLYDDSVTTGFLVGYK